MGLKATHQLRANVKALLIARKDDQKDLAFAIGRHPTTISKFLGGQRECQLEDVDAMADFFGLSAYQLFQPGMSALTERRRGTERRQRTRRQGHAQRILRDVASETERVRLDAGGRGAAHDPPSSLAEELGRLTDEYETRLNTLLSQAQSRGQAAGAGKALQGSRQRRRAASGSHAKKAEE